MKSFAIIIVFLIAFLPNGTTQEDAVNFHWGNAFYFNLDIGESISFEGKEVKLLQLKNHYNQLKIGGDTLWLKVSRRTLPKISNGIQVFVADNRNVKDLTSDNKNHSLLKKDALICLSDFRKQLLDPGQFVFPVSFNDGYQWNTEEDSHMFSYLGLAEWKEKGYYRSHEGIDFDMHNARGLEKHWLVAIEKSTVIWIEDKGLDEAGKEACVLLESDSQPGIYYVYKHLYNKNVIVRKGQKLVRGEQIGTIWGDEVWGHLHFAVVKSDSIPTYQNRYFNLINGFPQLYELYFPTNYNYYKTFSKGRIYFGKLRSLNGNQKNANAFEDYTGKGWLLGDWNPADKVEWVLKGNEGNVRLKKVLYENSKAVSRNPLNYYDYEIQVQPGIYRVRARVGDLFLPSWQKIVFEGLTAGTYSLTSGELNWTSEKIVKVEDGKLSIRIYIDEENIKVAGLSEIVFQKAY